jgi:hypothetical protein
MRFRPIRVVLLGAIEGPLRDGLAAALAQGNVRCELVPPDSKPIDVVLAVVRRGEAPGVLAAARSVAQRVPVVAILPVTDDQLAHDVLQCGANAWWPLDAPRDLLRSMVVVFAGGGPPVGAVAN